MAIDTMAGLREVYRPPAARAGLKVLDHLDVHCRRFIALSPFYVISSARADGRSDASPRGDPPTDRCWRTRSPGPTLPRSTRARRRAHGPSCIDSVPGTARTTRDRPSSTAVPTRSYSSLTRSAASRQAARPRSTADAPASRPAARRTARRRPRAAPRSRSSPSSGARLRRASSMSTRSTVSVRVGAASWLAATSAPTVAAGGGSRGRPEPSGGAAQAA